MGTTLEAMTQATHIGIVTDDFLPYGNSKSGTMTAMRRINMSRKKYTKAKLEDREVKDIFDKDKS